jgi:hypothetical protein
MLGKGCPMLPILCLWLRVTGYKFVKDRLHEQYKIEKMRHAKASETISSPKDVHESSRSGRKKNKMVQCESPSLVLANWWNLSTNLYAKCVD